MRRKHMNLLAGGLWLLSATLLSGCLLGPDYMRPEQPIGEKYSEPALPGESLANLPWWDLFTDPVLQDLIRTALEENKDLKVAAARVEQARAILGFTRADQFPRIDGSGNATRFGVSDNIIFAGNNPVNDFGVFGALSFEIDIWGRLRRATESQEARLLSTEYAQRAVIVSLVSQVATTYFQILGFEDRVAISRRTVGAREQNTSLNRARLSKGIIPELDVNQAEIEQAGATAVVFDFERGLRQNEHALAVLLGKVPNDIPRGKDLYQQSLRTELPVGFPAELLSRRPDVLSAEEALRAEVAQIGVATAGRYPSLSLLGFVGLQSKDSSDLLDSDSFTWSIGGSLLGPLLDFGKSRSLEEAQVASANAALNTYEQTVIQVVREVEDALVGIRTANEAFLQRELQTKAARNAARLSRARYDEGVTSYLEVLDIERSLFDAELNASASREQYLNSVVQLYKALGGGWVE